MVAVGEHSMQISLVLCWLLLIGSLTGLRDLERRSDPKLIVKRDTGLGDLFGESES